MEWLLGLIEPAKASVAAMVARRSHPWRSSMTQPARSAPFASLDRERPPEPEAHFQPRLLPRHCSASDTRRWRAARTATSTMKACAMRSKRGWGTSTTSRLWAARGGRGSRLLGRTRRCASRLSSLNLLPYRAMVVLASMPPSAQRCRGGDYSDTGGSICLNWKHRQAGEPLLVEET
jgi:hypothetical protein